MTNSQQNHTKKPLIEAALGRQPQRYPVWFMRQAGRYLPEYREVRSKTSFVELCQSPALAAEVTLQPLRRFDLDAAIIFSDILIPPTAMGQRLSFDAGEGPQLTSAVRSAADLRVLKRPDAERDLGYVGDAIAKTKASLAPTQAMIGFAGAPFTVASYMIEGASSKNFTEVKRLLYTDPATFKGLLELIGEVTVDYLGMQVKAGADIVMLFDTWAGQLSCVDYVEHVLPVMRKLIAGAKAHGVPVIYYPGQGCDRMPELSGLAMDVVSVDWRTRLAQAGAMLRGAGLDVTLQGNLDPQVLIGPEELIRARTRSVIEEAAGASRAHIFNVGHGLLPFTPINALGIVVDELRKAKIS